MPDVSPTKWHLAHTSWFFEQFVLTQVVSGYRPFHSEFCYLFNSYYDAVGQRHPRPQRGVLSRPTLEQIKSYREHVDQAMLEMLADADQGCGSARLAENWSQISAVVETGLHHEQQHQELLLTDIKHVFGCNPLEPVYRQDSRRPSLGLSENRSPTGPAWVAFSGGVVEIGSPGKTFCYDNEIPQHRQYLEPFLLADRLVTNAQYQEFIEDAGYRRSELWLSEGWACVQRFGWDAPLYWQFEGDSWTLLTLHGRLPLDPQEPVCHVSFYEADAFARWSAARLPTEVEWELAANCVLTAQSTGQIPGQFLEDLRFHPQAALCDQSVLAQQANLVSSSRTESSAPTDGLSSEPLRNGACQTREQSCDSQVNQELTVHQPLQLFGSAWEWTGSAYRPYPGYRPLPGALGEYNGKFMSNQMVLRGGSCVTSRSHIRPTYRNFLTPDARWQFTGIRLADDAD